MSKNNILKNIRKITLDFFKEINAEIKEENEIYRILLTKNYYELFNTSKLKFTFNSEVARDQLCELITPGSNILFKIINYNLKNGIIVYSKPENYVQNTNQKNSIGIRFYFYVLLDGVKNQSYVKYVDVDYNSFEIIQNNFSLINSEKFEIKFDSEKIDYSYISAIDEIRQIMKDSTDKFSKDVIEAKNDDLNYVNKEYQKRLDEIDVEIQNQRIKKDSLEDKLEEKLTDAIDKVELLRKEKKRVILGIMKKHQANIDYALFAAQVYPYIR